MVISSPYTVRNIVPWPGYEANCSQALPCVQMKYKEGKAWYNLHDVILWLMSSEQ